MSNAAAAWRGPAVLAGLALVLFGSALLIDPWAQAAFDAPKRLAFQAGTALAAAALVGSASSLTVPRWSAWPLAARVSAACALVAALLCVLAATQAAVPALASEGLRRLLFGALLLLVGAASLHARDRARTVGFAAAAVGLSAGMSLLQWLGLSLPLPLAQLGGRYATGALLGNEAFVALACALALPACTAVLLRALRGRVRQGALLLGLLGLAAILVNRQATAALAAGVGVLAVLAVHWRAQRLLAAATLAGLLLALCAALPPLRALSWAQLPLTTTRYQELTTYRLGAWAAAEEMIRSAPLLGHGPGSYAAQSQTWRLAAELRLQQRLPPAPPALGFAEAHQDYLQFAAEAGLPALAALLAALALLLLRLQRLAAAPGATEALALLGLLAAGAVTALAWFPLQIPLTAALLLLACGRAWRLTATPEPDA